MQKKRKHHIIPATYLSGFVDSNHKIYEYRSDDHLNPRLNDPRDVAYRRDYYAQINEDGSVDHNSIEDFFDRELESKWQPLVSKIRDKKELTSTEYDILLQFICMLRIRVPAMRDAVEHCLAQNILKTVYRLEKDGKVPERPPQIKEIVASINPQKSIESMTYLATGFNKILQKANIVIWHNQTSIPFLTSDNPVICFEACVNDRLIRPYSVTSRDYDSEIIFPITNNLLLHSHTFHGVKNRVEYKETQKKGRIRRFNRLIAKFAYERFYTSCKQHEPLVRKYHCESPVPNLEYGFSKSGECLFVNFVFGERKKLPKWKS